MRQPRLGKGRSLLVLDHKYVLGELSEVLRQEDQDFPIGRGYWKARGA